MTYQKLYEIISKPWLTIEDVSYIAGCGRNSALKIVKRVEEDICREGKILPHSKKKQLPTDRVLKVLGIDANTVYNNASRTLDKSNKKEGN